MDRSPGLLLADKPSGLGSAALVARLKRELGGVKVGHTGTLDRFTSGLMILLTGRGTAFADYFLHQDKSYRADFRLGLSTNTHDPTGEILEERSQEETEKFFRENRAGILATLLDFQKATSQRPPVFSALKKGGRRYSDLARSGAAEEPPERPIQVHELRILDVDESSWTITAELEVSSGTYIRSFARDLGDAIGFPAHLSALRRLSVGKFRLNDAELWVPDKTPPQTRSVTEVLDWERRTLSPDEAALVLQGRLVELQELPESGADFFLVDEKGGLLAWARAERTSYRFRKVFSD